jgi:transcriptional regulator of NAD metabolism
MSGYLVMQISKDKQSMYVGYCQVTKDRKFSFFVDKIVLSVQKRNELESMVKDLGQLKVSMMKTPITIQEDMQALEVASEKELSRIVAKMEEFFAPVTFALEKMICPEPV